MDSEVCRLCLVNLDIHDEDLFTSGFNLLDLESGQIKISDAVMECTSVNIAPDDYYSKLICMSCIQNLQTSYLFRQRSIASDAHLKETYIGFVTKNEAPVDGYASQKEEIKIEEVEINDWFDHNNVPDSSDAEDNLNLNELKNKIKLTCKKCKVTYSDLLNHTCLAFACSKCPKVFLENEDKVRHEKIHDLDIKGSYCGFCKIDFENSMEKYETHRTEICSFQRCIEYIEPPYVCSACQKSFQTKTHFETHLRIHSSERPFKCTECSKRFKQSSHLNIHMRRHTGLRPYQCNACSATFISNSGLTGHIMRKHAGESVVTTKFPAVRITRKRNSHRKFSCGLCGKTFLTKDSLDKHELIHSQLRPYVCEVCSKGFKQSSHLSIHRKIHSQEKNFQCPHCYRSFITNGALRKHIGSRHFNEPVPPPNKKHRTPNHWKCRFCDDIFTVREEYTAHIMEHQNNESFVCEECGTICKSRVLLHRHRKSHLGKSHQCSKCSKMFTTETELKHHDLYHSDEKPHQCELCGQRFKWRIGAWRHMMRHKGERPKKCNFCDKAFIEDGPLKRHMRVHTGERPQKCHICYRTFKEKTHLRTHMNGVHKEELMDLKTDEIFLPIT